MRPGLTVTAGVCVHGVNNTAFTTWTSRPDFPPPGYGRRPLPRPKPPRKPLI